MERPDATAHGGCAPTTSPRWDGESDATVPLELALDASIRTPPNSASSTLPSTALHATQPDPARRGITPPHARQLDLTRTIPTLKDHAGVDAALQGPPAVTITPHADPPAGEPTLAISATNAMPSDAELLRHLRGRVSSQSSTPDLRHALQAMMNQRSPAARRELLSALEYPGAATRLAELVAGGGLRELLQWLCPTDAGMTLAVAARVARLSQNASGSTSRRQDDMGRLFSAEGDGPGTSPRRGDARGREADTGTAAVALPPAVNAFLLTELFEEGRPFDPEPFAKRLAAALDGRGPSSTATSADTHSRSTRVLTTVESARPRTDVLTQTHRVATSRSPESTRTHANLKSEPKRPQSTSSLTGSTHAAAPGSAHPAVSLSPVRTVSPLQDTAINQRIYIANAGVVFVAPYLPRLFSMLELTYETAFTSTSCAHRAVHLVQYIVTGATTTPEPLLVLNKILCGLPISEPVPLDIDLRVKERAAIEEMLTAIIAHWQAIGRTSVAGLRESFLQREGRLVCAEESWQLRVESKCFDMLLDRLPWGYATMKFPWMTVPEPWT